jgi:hypothetical protein
MRNGFLFSEINIFDQTKSSCCNLISDWLGVPRIMVVIISRNFSI